jgi:hypothetical protein
MALTAVISVTVHSTALAQAIAVAHDAPVCSAGASPMVDSSTVTVIIGSGTAWNRRTFTAADQQRILYYADAIRSRFVPPPTLGAVPTLAESPIQAWGGEVSRHSAVGGKLVLVTKPNGRLREAFWQVLPLSAPFARAVYVAAIMADTAHDFDGIPGGETGRVDDTLVVQVRTITGELTPSELPLMRARLASYLAERPSYALKKGDLVYPTNAGNAGVENEGEMQVIVGSDGKAVMSSTQVTRIDWRDFVGTMRRAIAESVYQPAMSNGCAVPSVAIERFKFSVRR